MDKTTEEKEPRKKSSILNILIKYVLPLALGVVILYFLFRDVNIEEMWAILKGAKWPVLLFSLIFGLLGNTIRGYRWELLIRPLGYTPKVSILNYAIYGGYAINYALPRAGEIWRCGIVAKEEKIPFTKVIGTMVLDRVFDTLMVLLITLVAFLLNMQVLIAYLKQNKAAFDSLVALLQSPLLYAAIIGGIALIVIIFKFFKSNKIVRKISDLFIGLANDMKAIWQMKTKGRLLFYSFAIWGSYFLYFYITFYAFNFTESLGVSAGLVAFALSSISMGVPSNGGLGPWQIAVVAALTLYGVDKVSATAFATGVFGVQSLWVIACGLFGMTALSMKKAK